MAIDWQWKLLLALDVICVAIVAVLDSRAAAVAVNAIIAFFLVVFGQKLYASETTENWLKFSYGDTIKSVVGGALMLVGWLIFLQRVLVVAMAVLFLFAV